MRAGRLDLVIETGAAWSREVQVLTPGQPVAASTVSAGTRVYLDHVPVRVASVTPNPNGSVTWALGDGLYSDPVRTLPGTALVAPAELVEVLEAAAAFRAIPEVAPRDTVAVEIPVSVSLDGSSVILAYGADETALIPAEAYSWDLYVRTAEWDWTRALEGTLTVIEGDAR